MRYRLIIGVMLLAMAAAATARADVKLAYVDIQRALNECRAGKAAKGDFRGRIDHLQSQLEGEQNDVERLKRELEQKGALMQPDQRQNLEDEYGKKLRQFQDDYKNSRDELQQKDNEVTSEIVRDLAVVVRQISLKSGYTMVMEKGTLLWAVPSTDITDEVIRAYDAMNVKPGSLSQEAASGAGFGRGGASVAPDAPPEGDSGSSGRSTILK
ncbi:MAG TPA: OmpH family outer membrane protein [Candidatus Binataceae bacterium]|nr:OmpH family outer membrane protein [Candidatus Binataceae bacterium]